VLEEDELRVVRVLSILAPAIASEVAIAIDAIDTGPVIACTESEVVRRGRGPSPALSQPHRRGARSSKV
jgi:hypothetical protein